MQVIPPSPTLMENPLQTQDLAKRSSLGLAGVVGRDKDDNRAAAQAGVTDFPSWNELAIGITNYHDTLVTSSSAIHVITRPVFSPKGQPRSVSYPPFPLGQCHLQLCADAGDPACQRPHHPVAWHSHPRIRRHSERVRGPSRSTRRQRNPPLVGIDRMRGA